MIIFYRVFVILFCLVSIATVVTHEFPQPLYKFLAVFGLLVALLTLLLFADLCSDMKRIRHREEDFPFASLGGGASLADLLQPGKMESDSMMELGGIPIRDVGDRKFKADATKVCNNCKWIDESSRSCGKDDLSLEGITVSAVGCQHWTLGLTVTENEPPAEEEEDS